jgi:hypothetical protein
MNRNSHGTTMEENAITETDGSSASLLPSVIAVNLYEPSAVPVQIGETVTVTGEDGIERSGKITLITYVVAFEVGEPA